MPDDFDLVGENDPRQMPSEFFGRHVRLDYSSAIRADTSKQDFSVLPRCWDIDATVICNRCGEQFCFTATEQKAWYEDYAFYVWSSPKECRACRRELRRLKSLRQEYDREIARALLTCTELEVKTRIASVIDQLCEADEDLPAKAHESRKVLAQQIARRSGPNAA